MDDIYVNDGESYQDSTYYPAPALTPEQQEAEQQAQATVASSWPVMEAISKWFDDQVAKCDSISNLDAGLTHYGVQYSKEVSLEAQVLAWQLVKDRLLEKANEFAKFREQQ